MPHPMPPWPCRPVGRWRDGSAVRCMCGGTVAGGAGARRLRCRGITTKLIMAGDAQGKVVGIMLPALEKSKVNAITYPTQSIITYNKTVHKLQYVPRGLAHPLRRRAGEGRGGMAR